MKRLLIIAASMGALAGPTAALATASPAAGKYCGSVTLEPNSDYVDALIRTNIDCPHAIAVAVRWSVEGHKARPYGFVCRHHTVYQGLAHADVRCARGSRFVTFEAS